MAVKCILWYEKFKFHDMETIKKPNIYVNTSYDSNYYGTSLKTLFQGLYKRTRIYYCCNFPLNNRFLFKEIKKNRNKLSGNLK